MANRILRDWTDSENIDKLSFQAEVLFIRLFMKADDFGCFYANPKLIKAAIFPLKDVRESDITRWVDECQKSGVIAFYESKEKKYLQIVNFGQRLRTMRRKFPNPADNCPPHVYNKPPETKQESETELENINSKNFFYIGTEIYKGSVTKFIERYYVDFLTVWKIQNKDISIDEVLSQMEKDCVCKEFTNEEHIKNTFKKIGRDILEKIEKKNNNNYGKSANKTTNFDHLTTTYEHLKTD